MTPPVETVIESRAGGSQLRLVILGDELASAFPLPEGGEVIVGRGEDADLRIDHPSVSRRHARLVLGPTPTLEDLGSSNGTQIAGTRLEANKPVPIRPGELIELGSVTTVLQRYVSRGTAGRVRRIWTHSYFEARIEEECDRAQREGKTFALIRVRAEGVPQAQVEEALGARLRPGDLLAAFGPGDYEILLPDTLAPRAKILLRQLEVELAQAGTVRTACVSFPEDGRTPEQLVGAAQAALRGESADAHVDPGGVIIADAQMRSLHELVRRVAEGQIPILLLGESGVGKEIFAEAVHRHSPRRDKPFVRLNCAALSETLLESELFGHEKGAFTGAVKAKVGLLESAEGGTVFLDELGEMPMATQVKFLRVLEQREVLPVGALRPKPIDVRFVAATNRDLEAEIAQGRFRQDLYFRLNAVAIQIPPLRERVAEIELLARRFATDSAQKLGRPTPTISAEALSLLQRYPWPGNIRELRNVMERAVLLCVGGRIELEHLPVDRLQARALPSPAAPHAPAPPPARSSPSSSGTTPMGRPLATAPEMPAVSANVNVGGDERARILDALQRAGGNQKEAARLLGISRGTLLSRLDQFGIQRPRKKAGGAEPEA